MLLLAVHYISRDFFTRMLRQFEIEMDLLTTNPFILGSAIVGLALKAMAVYAVARKDRALLIAFLVLNPIYGLFILFYVIPMELYVRLQALRVEIIDSLYGEDVSPCVYTCLCAAATLLMTIAAWVIVKRFSARPTKKAYRQRKIPLLLCTKCSTNEEHSVCSKDDHPYRRGSFDSYL